MKIAHHNNIMVVRKKRKNICYKAGRFSLGKWRDCAEHRNIEAAFQVIKCFYQHAFRLTEASCLPVLRNAP